MSNPTPPSNNPWEEPQDEDQNKPPRFTPLETEGAFPKLPAEEKESDNPPKEENLSRGWNPDANKSDDKPKEKSLSRGLRPEKKEPSDELDELDEERLKKEWKREEVKKDALRVMGKIPLVLIVGYLIFQTFIATSEYTEGLIEDRYEFEDSLQTYQEQIMEGVAIRNSQLDVDPNTLGVTEVFDDEGATVTTGNFEGPQLFIEAMEFGDQVIDLQKHPGVLDYSVTSLLFDPDHSKLGLPDLDVRVSPVKMYEAEEGKLKAVLENIKNLLPGKGGEDKPKPYSVYTKEVKLRDGTIRKIAMQLWLTEFQVTIGAKPDIFKKKQITEIQKALETKLKKLEESPAINQEVQSKIDSVNREIAKRNPELGKFRSEMSLLQSQLEGLKNNRGKLNDEIEKNQKRLIKRSTSKRRERKEELVEQDKALTADMENLQNKLVVLEDTIGKINEALKPYHAALASLNEEMKEFQVKNSPESWYDKEGIRDVSPNDIGTATKAENLNQVYGDVKIWLRVMPNASPWYVKTKNAENLKPKMAIGAIYCTKVINDVLEDTKYKLDAKQSEAQLNVSEGIAVALYDKMNFQLPLDRRGKVQELTPLRSSNHYLNEKANASIWDKTYYMKIFLKNVGSHKKTRAFGKKNLKEYDDQFTFHFLMPLLVRGSWDVMAPNEVIPDWKPPKPRTIEGFSFSNLLPSWGFSFLGKTASFVLMAGAILFVLNFFFPGLKGILVYLSNILFDGIKGFFNAIKKMIEGIKNMFAKKEDPTS